MTHENNEQLFRSILDHVPDAITIMDLEGIILDCNTAMLDLHGYTSKEEMVNRSAFTLIPEYEQERARGELARARQQGRIKDIEFILLRKDNTEFPAEISAGVIHDAAGLPIGLVIISKDITERIRTAEALREREASLQSIFRAAPTGIGVVSNRVLLRVNDRLCEMLQYAPEELLGRDARLLYPSDEEYEWVGREKYRQIGETGVGTVETRWVRKGGSIIDVLLSSAPFDPEAMTNEVTFVALDITERKQAEKDLEVHRTFSDTAGQGFGFADLNGVITYANSALLRLVGLERAGEMIGTNVTAYYSRAVAKELMTKILPEVSREGQWLGELLLKSVKGTVTPTIHNIFIIRGPDGAPTHFGNVLTNIAEQKKAEEALRESKERFDIVTQQSREMVWQVDADGRFAYISRASEDILGYRPEEIVGKMHFYDLHPKQGRSEFRRAALTLIAQKRSFSNTINTVETKTGSIVMLSSSGMPILDEEGNLKGYVGADLDITERQRAEEALRESEERFRRIFEEGALGMVTTGANYCFLRANAAFCRMVGYSEKELTALSFKDITHPEHVAQDAESVKKLIAGEMPLYRTEKRYIRKDKGIIWANTVVSIVRDKNGKFLYSLAMIEDITERKRAEEALRESRGILQAILNSIPVRVFWKDKDLVYLGCNTPFARDAGFEKPEEIIGKDDRAMGWREQAELYRADDRVVIESGNAKLLIEEPQTTPLGEQIHLLTSKVPLRDADGTIVGVLGTYQDITERKRMEEALRREWDRAQGYLDTVETIIVALDAEGKITTINRKGAQLFGCREDELIGQVWFSTCLPQPEGMETVYRVFQKLMVGEMESLEYYENPIITRSKELRQIAWHNAILRDERGRIIGTLSAGEDITERKREADKLREATEKLKLEHKALLEKNIALKEFLDHMNQGKEDFKHEISSSIYNLLYPVVKELRKTGGYLGIRQIDQLENNIKSIVKKNVDEFKLNYDRLTAREMEICELIRKGMSSKEIAETLNIARETVHKHRESIRRKLQLRGKGINLPAFLKSRPG